MPWTNTPRLNGARNRTTLLTTSSGPQPPSLPTLTLRRRVRRRMFPCPGHPPFLADARSPVRGTRGQGRTGRTRGPGRRARSRRAARSRRRRRCARCGRAFPGRIWFRVSCRSLPLIDGCPLGAGERPRRPSRAAPRRPAQHGGAAAAQPDQFRPALAGRAREVKRLRNRPSSAGIRIRVGRRGYSTRTGKVGRNERAAAPVGQPPTRSPGRSSTTAIDSRRNGKRADRLSAKMLEGEKRRMTVGTSSASIDAARQGGLALRSVGCPRSQAR